MQPYLIDAEAIAKYARTMAEIANDALSPVGSINDEMVEHLNEGVKNMLIEKGLDENDPEFHELMNGHMADPMKYFHYTAIMAILDAMGQAAATGLFANVAGTVADIQRVDLPEEMASNSDSITGGGIAAGRRPMDDREIEQAVNNAMADVDDFLKNLTEATSDENNGTA